jgi:hypothetical protein
MSSGPSTEQPSVPTLPAYRYHAEVVGDRDRDGGPRHLTPTGRPINPNT